MILAWEGDDPELRVQHFLTVASYNLQHPAQFTDEALAGLWAAFCAHLDQGLGIPEIRRRMTGLASGSRRVLRPQAERRPLRRSWSTTIADVYIPTHVGAAERVRAWAASIRRELPAV